uniref:Guanine nucleotide-binding protein subunit gamma 2-like n=1 Tax=Kalanchoe fedtschenkoi TaxID=63787 RepID=A0A7N0TLH3_KALFE
MNRGWICVYIFKSISALGSSRSEMAGEEKQEGRNGAESCDGVCVPSPGFVSRRKMIASISSLNRQISNIQEEVDHLADVCASSVVCEEVVLSVESLRDPLLPITKGPADDDWDRWFRPAGRASGGRKRWKCRII